VITLIDITDRHQAEEAARANEQRLRLVAQSTSDYAIIVQDTAGSIVSWNAGAERIFDYTEAEMVGQDIELIYEPNDRQALVPARERDIAVREGRADDERWHRTREGRRIYCSGVVTPISDASFNGFAKIVRDLTARKQREDANREALAREQAAREQALSSNQLKDEFIAVLSHELKHPLNLIGVKTEMLPRLPETRDSPAVREAAASIRAAVRAQAQLIDDLLDWSRIQTGKLTLDVTRVDLASMLRNIADTCEHDAHARGLVLETDLPADAAIVLADPVRCEQILWNLMSNALKFTGAGGHIKLRLSLEGRMLRLDVTDDGQGIDAATLPYVFDMFRQGTRDHSRSGLGIGLALVRQLVDMHGGQISAASDGPGQGAAISVWLPAAAEERSPSGQGGEESHNVTGPSILLVEDERETAESLTALLELEAASVKAAGNGAAALEILPGQSFDAIVSDIGLPDMSGYALMRRIRTDPRWADIRTIALTGHSRDEDVQAARDAGFDVHLAKPLDFQLLLAALADLTPDGGLQARGCPAIAVQCPGGPMHHRDIVVVAASRGGLPVLRTLVATLAADLPAIVCIVLHIGRHRSILPELLSRWGPLEATHAAHGEVLQTGRIYIAPPDRHMVLRDGGLCLLDTAAENFARPAADPLFRSAARGYQQRVVGVVLSGDLDDGAAGLAAIRARGGYGVVQDPADAEAPSMPNSALAAAGADAVVKVDDLSRIIHAAVHGAKRREEVHMTTRPHLDREAQIGEAGLVMPADLDEIGERSALTCPSCNGALWRISEGRPLRYRCHTGHAFSALSLDEAGAQSSEDAMWSAIRAVHERMIFARERQQWARRTGSDEDIAIEQARIDENQKLADLLRDAVGAAILGSDSERTKDPSAT
jgi:PAS domain S-box-containing protein